MTPNETRDQDVVTQADREAAALLFDRTSWEGWDSTKDPHSGAANHMLEGRGDGSPYVQAFARHLLASTLAFCRGFGWTLGKLLARAIWPK